MSSQIITGLWSSNFLGNHSETKIASENTRYKCHYLVCGKGSFTGIRYILVLNQKTLKPPPPTNSWFYSTFFFPKLWFRCLHYLQAFINYSNCLHPSFFCINSSYFCVCACMCKCMLVCLHFLFLIYIYI